MTRFTMPAPTRDEVRRGISYMIGAVLIFAAANALVKWQVALYPITEVVFCCFSARDLAVYEGLLDGG